MQNVKCKMQNGGCAAALGGEFAALARADGADVAANVAFGGAAGAIGAANGAKGAANAAFGGAFGLIGAELAASGALDAAFRGLDVVVTTGGLSVRRRIADGDSLDGLAYSGFGSACANVKGAAAPLTIPRCWRGRAATRL